LPFVNTHDYLYRCLVHSTETKITLLERTKKSSLRGSKLQSNGRFTEWVGCDFSEPDRKYRRRVSTGEKLATGDGGTSGSAGVRIWYFFAANRAAIHL
jgi:hypothetical protein